MSSPWTREVAGRGVSLGPGLPRGKGQVSNTGYPASLDAQLCCNSGRTLRYRDPSRLRNLLGKEA